MDKFPLPNERNIKPGLIHLPIPSLVMANETEQRRFLPSADTLVYTRVPKYPNPAYLGKQQMPLPLSLHGK